VTRTRKAALTSVLLVVGLAMVPLAAATGTSGPLFGAFVPFLAIPWVLTRPEPGAGPGPATAPGPGGVPPADPGPGSGRRADAGRGEDPARGA
jgi:hypothetical protein